MKTYLHTHLTVALIATICACALVGSVGYVRYSERMLEQSLLRNIEVQLETIRSLAQQTNRNGADLVTERIVTDCGKREMFEDYLSRLSTLSHKELLLTQQLYESCGRFFVERKALMVSRLEREYEILEETLGYLAQLRDLTPREEEWSTWSEVIALEENRRAPLAEQAELQAKIIELLIVGGSDSRQEIATQIQRASELNESLAVLAQQIDTLRKTVE